MKTSPVPERLYSCREVARRLNTSDDTVRRLITGGIIKGVRIGKRSFRVPASALAKYIADRPPVYRLAINGQATWSVRKKSDRRPATHLVDTTGTSGAKPNECDHDWVVFSTVPADAALLVQCVECGAYGRVTDPTEDEWRQAFHAPSNPYHWPHGDRVELLPGTQPDEAKRHVRRRPAHGEVGSGDENDSPARVPQG